MRYSPLRHRYGGAITFMVHNPHPTRLRRGLPSDSSTRSSFNLTDRNVSQRVSIGSPARADIEPHQRGVPRPRPFAPAISRS